MNTKRFRAGSMLTAQALPIAALYVSVTLPPPPCCPDGIPPDPGVEIGPNFDFAGGSAMVAPPGGWEYQQRVPQSNMEQVAVYREITVRDEPHEVVRVEVSQTGDFRLI